MMSRLQNMEKASEDLNNKTSKLIRDLSKQIESRVTLEDL